MSDKRTAFNDGALVYTQAQWDALVAERDELRRSGLTDLTETARKLEAAEAKIESQTTLRRRARLAEEKLQARVAIEREGIVTVYDHKGVYQGCMGVETWAWMLAHPGWDANDFAAIEARAEAAEKERDEALGIETEVILDDLRAAEARVTVLEAALDDVPEAMDSCVEYMEAAERDGLEPWSVAATTVKAHCSVTAEDARAALAAPTKEGT